MTSLVADGLAAFRIVRLVQTDRITQPLRDRFPPNRWLTELMGCSYCLGVWAAFGVRLLPSWLRQTLAVAAVAGILSEHYGD